MIFTSEAKRVLYRKGADIPVDGQLNEGTWILIQICFVDQHGVGPRSGPRSWSTRQIFSVFTGADWKACRPF